MCNKGFIWNPSNCECEFDKACNVGEYLDHGNRKCRKILIAPLIEECTETVEEVKLAKITIAENSYKCSFYTVYIVLLIAVPELLLILFFAFGLCLKIMVRT